MLRRQAPFDAIAHGAKCGECPFRCSKGVRLPVGPTVPAEPIAGILVAEGPGRDENTTGQVLVGATGRLLDGLLPIAGLKRSNLYLTNATKCMPPFGATEKEFKQAVASCRPALVAELATLTPSLPVLAAGGLALAALAGETGILEFIGVPLAGLPDVAREVMPIVHPAAALPHRTPALSAVLIEHLTRYDRMLKGTWRLAPRPARIITDKDGEAVILAAIKELWSAPSLGVDVETPMMRRPLEFFEKAKRLLNVGVASYKLGLAVCVTWYNTTQAIKDAIIALVQSNIPKRLQNGIFDARVLRVNGIEIGAWAMDTMDVFRLCFPGLPAGLDFIAAFLTTHERWKDQFRSAAQDRWERRLDKQLNEEAKGGEAQDRGDGVADGPLGYAGEIEPSGGEAHAQMARGPSSGEAVGDSDEVQDDVRGRLPHLEEGVAFDRFEHANEEERAEYCAMDSCNQDEIGDILEARLASVHRGEERQQFRHRLILASLEMWWAGIKVDNVARLRHREPLEAAVAKWHREAVEAAKDLGWAVKKTVEFGRKDKETGVKQFRIEDVEFNPGSTAHITKLLVETYGMKPLAYTASRKPQWDAEVMEYLCGAKDVKVRSFARKVRNYKLNQKRLSVYIIKLPVYGDGRLHPVWKACAANTTRWTNEWASNIQAMPKELRDLIAADGWVGEADFAQLELKMVALRAGDAEWLEIFKSGKDVHRANAADMFGLVPKDISDKQRFAAKPTVFCFIYDGAPQTAWAKLQENEDYKNVSIASIEAMHKGFFAGHPDIKQFHQKCRDDARKGRIVCPFSGHELITYGYVDSSLDCNFPIQTPGAWLTNNGLLKFRQQAEGTGDEVVAHQHDALWAYGSDGERLATNLRTSMERELTDGANKCYFNVDVKLSRKSIKGALDYRLDGSFKVPKSYSGSSTLEGWRAMEGVFND